MTLTRKLQPYPIVFLVSMALLLSLLSISFLLNVPASTPNGIAQDVVLGQVPDGLAADEWQAIQDVMASAEYHFAYHEANATNATPYYWAPNRTQGWQTVFTPQGVQVTPRGEETWNWGLTLTGYGYGAERIQFHDPPGLSAEQATLTYAWDENLTEWWINAAAGLEQGFTVQERPGPANGQPLTLELGLTGSLLPVQKSEVVAFTDASGVVVLTYDKLHVTDAQGQILPAHLQLVTHATGATQSAIHIQVDDAQAVYPLTIDPWVQSAKLTASDGAGSDQFGVAVAVDGNTVVVGAPGHDSGKGSVYVFVKPVGGWVAATETAKLTASDGAGGDRFGFPVAVSGETIVAGAAYGNGSGSAYVFVKPGGGWVTTNETAKLTASDGAASDRFGGSVAISGETVVVGASGIDDFKGAAYLFVKPVNGWATTTEIAKLTASDGMSGMFTGDVFGTSVAVDGETVVVGATSADSAKGAAYLFLKPEGDWASTTETVKLVASDGTSGMDTLGNSVAVRSDTIVIGAYGDDVYGPRSGSAYVFVKPGGGWGSGGTCSGSPLTCTQDAKLIPSAGAMNYRFAVSVAIDGDTIIAGAFGEDDSTGSAYVFVKPEGGWGSGNTCSGSPLSCTQDVKIRAFDSVVSDRFGYSVTVSEDTILVGAFGANSLEGSAYIYQSSGTATPTSPPPTATATASPQPATPTATATATASPQPPTPTATATATATSTPPTDGNGDGIPDAQQPNVETISSTTGNYITLAGPSGATLENVQSSTPVEEPPVNVALPQGLLGFEVNSLSAGSAFSVTLTVHSGPAATGYWKYGPTPDNSSDHWYDFTYDGETGAVINGNQITLHFVDGKRGDSDLAANGSIVDPGGPATVQYRIYLPGIDKRPAPSTTSNATLARPVSGRDLGLLGGLLAAGFALGMVVLFSSGREDMEYQTDTEDDE